MIAGLDLSKYCRDISLKVGNGNVVTGSIRPAGQRDVTVTIIGLDFNTPDGLVIDYLGKFGSVIPNSVVYSKFDSGPFHGKFNGERKFRVDFSKSNRRQMGTYHLIDGNKVRVLYRGNSKTCARCHKQARDCPGEGLAKNCSSAGGQHIPLSQHMRALWEELGFTPAHFELDEDEVPDDDTHQAELDQVLNLSPQNPPSKVQVQPSERDISKFDGISIKNIPKAIEDKDIYEFLVHLGLPSDIDIQNFRINRGNKSTWVMVDGIDTSVVQTLYSSIHYHQSNQKFFEVPLYCKQLRNSSPLKPSQVAIPSEVSQSSSTPVNTEPRPLIPGLPEAERIKALTRKIKPKSVANETLTRDFFIKPKVACAKSTIDEQLSQYEFSDYELEGSEENEHFEDSKEVLSESESESNEESSIFPATAKRQLESPENKVEHKKKKKNQGKKK